MLTYPRFAKACYAFFAVAVLAAILKLGISSAQPAPLKMLPATPTASAAEPAKPPEGPDDPRLVSFSDDRGPERLEAALSRPASRKDVLEGSDGSSDDASVFRRPSLNRASSEPVCGDLGDAPGSSRVVFPLPEEYFNSYDDTWGAARPQGGHEGSDLMSPVGTPEFAVTDGRLVEVAGSNENGWNTLGGYAVMLEAAYDVGPIEKGDLFYYAHMDRESSLPVGARVRAGQRIGTVGDTGEGPEVTRGKFPPHLHLGWYDADLSKQRSEVESGAMNPYPLLAWLEENGGSVSGGADASYCQAPQGAKPTPSTGEPDWPTPSAPGKSPDLDTGSDEDASPSPVFRDDRPRGDRPEGNGGKNPGIHKDHETAAKGQGSEAEEPEKARKKATKLSPRKKTEEKTAALLRDLPSRDSDRSTPKNGHEGEQKGKKIGSGRKDGEAAKERDEGRQETERPAENRPEGNQTTPPEKTLEAPAPVTTQPEETTETPAPVVPTPDRKPRPAPEGTGEAPEVMEKPGAATPPEVEQQRPTVEPDAPPKDETGEPAVDDAASGGATVPVRDEAPPVVEEEAEPAVQAGVGGQRPGPEVPALGPVSTLPGIGQREGSP